MATTLGTAVDFIYDVLQDKDAKVRWTRDEITQYLNFALRDAVVRRAEVGVITDTNVHLVAGARQTLPAEAVRLREIVCNVERVITYPLVTGVSVGTGGTTIDIDFDIEVGV